MRSLPCTRFLLVLIVFFASMSAVPAAVVVTGIVESVIVVDRGVNAVGHSWGIELKTTGTWDTLDGGLFASPGGSLAMTGFTPSFPSSGEVAAFPNDTHFEWHLDDPTTSVVSFFDVDDGTELSTDGATQLATMQGGAGVTENFAQVTWTTVSAPTIEFGLEAGGGDFLELKSAGVLVGTIAGTFNTTGVFPPTGGTPGDFNNDGSVDAADYALWRNSVGDPDGTLENDGDLTGDIGPAHYNLWRSHYGESSALVSPGSPAPEPSGLGMAIATLSLMGGLSLPRRAANTSRH